MRAEERAMLDMAEAYDIQLRKLRRERNDAIIDANAVQQAMDKQLAEKDRIIARQDARIERLKATVANLTAITVKADKVKA